MTRPSSLEAVTRLLWPFAYERRSGSRRRKPLPDLGRPRELLLGTTAASGKRGKTFDVWEPLPETTTEEQTQRLIAPLQDYLGGRTLAGSHVLSLRATARAVEILGKELVIGDLAARDTSTQKLATAEDLDPDFGLKTFHDRHGCGYFFRLSCIELYLFSTGVGILVLEVEATGGVLEIPPSEGHGGDAKKRQYEAGDVAELNARLQRLGKAAPPILNLRPLRARRYGKSEKGSQKPSVEAAGPLSGDSELAELRDQPGQELLADVLDGRCFRMEPLISWLVAPLRGPDAELHGMAGSHLRGLSYLRLPPRSDNPSPLGYTREELGNLLFRLRRMYNDFHSPPVHLLSTEPGNPEVLQTFERIFFGLAQEGMAVVVLDDTETPFFSEMASRVRHGYFALYLLCLHQRTALERLSIRAAKGPRLVSSVTRPFELARHTLDQVRFLRLEAADFTLHHSFSIVSPVTMYQEVYERLAAALRIDVLHRRLRTEIDEIDSLLQHAAEKHEERSRRGIELVIALFAPLALLFGFWGANFTEIADPSSGPDVSWVGPAALRTYQITLLVYILLIGTWLAPHLRRLGSHLKWLRREREPQRRVPGQGPS